MTAKQGIVSFDDIIQAGELYNWLLNLILIPDIAQGRQQREKQKLAEDMLGQGRREKQRLADEILGKGRKANTQSNGVRSPNMGGSLASRVGIVKASTDLALRSGTLIDQYCRPLNVQRLIPQSQSLRLKQHGAMTYINRKDQG